ncbi:GNAT superfamily N-acetyltransferase [Fontibacillus solani]|uniref:GNAT superfamily N-acetyltransferase n=1 Tax=Fontibacillus solani TaxID=1572857 RepID=A0A7W3SVH3_9BACL|nr:GNAT family N-acetyltransferase [Fontibacillus solani]MBA9086894.1 GNAT superfamily N-acetyltransferase [Fontibacillus solani]
MNDLFVRICNHEDLEQLASLNKQLIEDEEHDNKMNLEQLKKRMKSFMSTGYKAYFFLEQNDIKGYALVDHERKPLYLRQFFICRENRRQGYGRLALNKLLAFLSTQELDIEVMFWNERGYRFWKSLGFTERSIYMRLENVIKE